MIIGIVLLGLLIFSAIKNNYDTNIYFSKETGYYNKAFKLRISGGAGNKIYYTLDGSEPTQESSLYDEKHPIYIDDASKNKNKYSEKTDISTGFLTDLIENQSTGDPGYAIPNYNVDKCTVVRAVVFDEDGNKLDSKEGVYFVGFQKKDTYEKVYTVSIVTDPGNLFDYEKGIYTLGSTFDDYIENSFGKEGDKHTPYWWWWDSNYSNSGPEWEREVQLTIFNPKHSMLLSENCGIRIQGGGSRGFLPKSIGCYAREEYSGNNRFSVDLFGDEKNPHKFVLFSGGDDNIFKLKDYLVNTLAQELNFATMDFLPCVLFLNGEFWGSYYMIENYNASYVRDHYGVEDENVIIFKNGEIKEGTSEDEELYYEMRYFIAPNDMTIPEYYEQACEMIDVDSFIDYYASQIYISRMGDWPDTNYALWRTRDEEESAYGDCKWRWMLFDVNSGGLDYENVEADTLAYILEEDALFHAMYQNETFRVKFVNRLLEIGREVYSVEKCNELIDYYVATMKKPILSSNRRFYNNVLETEFEENVKQMKLFFERRYEIVWKFLVENMGTEWMEMNGIVK